MPLTLADVVNFAQSSFLLPNLNFVAEFYLIYFLSSKELSSFFVKWIVHPCPYILLRDKDTTNLLLIDIGFILKQNSTKLENYDKFITKCLLTETPQFQSPNRVPSTQIVDYTCTYILLIYFQFLAQPHLQN